MTNLNEVFRDFDMMPPGNSSAARDSRSWQYRPTTCGFIDCTLRYNGWKAGETTSHRLHKKCLDGWEKDGMIVCLICREESPPNQ